MPGNIFVGGQVPSLLLGVGRTLLQSKINREGISILLEGIENSHIPVGVCIF